MVSLYCPHCHARITCPRCGQQDCWSCGYCEQSESDTEVGKWFEKFKNAPEEIKHEMMLEQDKEMILEDLKQCPLTRVQVDELCRLRDSFSEKFEELT